MQCPEQFYHELCRRRYLFIFGIVDLFPVLIRNNRAAEKFVGPGNNRLNFPAIRAGGHLRQQLFYLKQFFDRLQYLAARQSDATEHDSGSYLTLQIVTQLLTFRGN
ncbi:MAG: hypothetical protein ACD_39C00553G0001 [uncultured bacterium]|nr:MAG: hypothetical protein ACD_39C00553G0001 [uncultured bacterium]